MRFMITIAVSIVVLAGCAMTGSISIGKYFRRSDTAWNNLGGDAARSGYSPTAFKAPMTKAWERKVSSSPGLAITAVDSIVYLTTADGRFYALSAGEGHLIGNIKYIHAAMPGLALRDHIAVVGLSHGKDNLVAYDVFDSRYRFIKETGGIECNPLIYDTDIYFGTLSKKFYAVRFADGETIWSVDLTKPMRSSPAVQGLYVYFGGDDGTVYALNRFDGKTAWKFQTRGAVFASPVVDENRVFIGSTDSSFYALDATNGTLLWRLPVGGDRPANFFAPAAVGPEAVVAVSSDGTVRALNKENGGLIWRYDAGSNVGVAPVITPELVFVASMQGRVSALDPRTGEEKWHFVTESRIKTNMAVVGEFLIVGCENGKIYAFKNAK